MRAAVARDPALADLKVTGGTHPLGASREIAARGAQIAQWSAIVAIGAGDLYILPALRLPVPRAYARIAPNRVGYLMLAFFAGNMVSNSLQKTGAFEVYYDGRLVWSKLQSGQAPEVRSILRALSKARA